MKQFILALKRKDIGAQLFRSFSSNAVLKINNLLLNFFLGVLLSRLLGPTEFGVYSYVLSIVVLVCLPVSAGLPSLIVREVAQAHMKENWHVLRGLLTFSNGIIVLYALLVFLVLGVILWADLPVLPHISRDHLIWASVLLPFIALNTVRGSALIGLKQVLKGNAPDQVIRPALILLLLLISYSVGMGVNTDLVLQFNIAATFLAFLCGIYFLVRTTPRQIWQTTPVYETGKWVKAYLPLFVFSGVYMANNQVGVVFLGSIDAKESVGLYRIAEETSNLISFTTLTFSAILGPYFVQLYGNQEMEKLNRLLKNSTRLIFGFSILVAAVFIGFDQEIIGLLFGKAYIASTEPFVVLCIARLIVAALGPLAVVLTMVGDMKTALQGAFCAISINIMLCATLIPDMQLMGAAYSYLAATLISGVFIWAQIYRKLGLDCSFIGLGNWRK